MPTIRTAAASLLTVSALLIGSGCSTPQADEANRSGDATSNPAPSNSAPSSPEPSAPSSPASSGPDYPPASVTVTGSPKAGAKPQKEAVKVTRSFLVAFNKSFSEGEVQPEIFLLAPRLAAPMRTAIEKDEKKDRTYGGEVRYTLKKVSGDRTSATVGVCSDHTDSVTITDGKAKSGKRRSQEVKLTYTATPERRGFAAEALSDTDTDYC